MQEVVIGIDLGTQGCRVLTVDENGVQISSIRKSLPSYQTKLPMGWHEQDPEKWRAIISDCLRKTVQNLPPKTTIKGIAVDSTSGTLVITDKDGKLIHPAIMYNDSRSLSVIDYVREFGSELENSLGYKIGSSFALPKIVWFLSTFPEYKNKKIRFIHAADFVVGCLTGNYSISDYSNAFKTGYDVKNGCWPKFIQNSLGISFESLPTVETPGKLIGVISQDASKETFLKADIPVYAGATDGTAALIASGVKYPGDWNSTLGTTLYLKGLSKSLHVDPKKRIYSHLHPEGLWIPGAASNTGGEWITKEYPNFNLVELDKETESYIPTRKLRYPLVRQGERFPFNNSSAIGFQLGKPENKSEAFAVGLEGVALLEKLAFETMEEIGLKINGDLYVTGGGANSSIWLTIRASMLGRSLFRPKNRECAMGAAILAATGAWYGTLKTAVNNMVSIEDCFEPDQVLSEAYAEKYTTFIDELRKRQLI